MEKKFENYLKLLLNVEFLGPPQYFLGVKVKFKKDNTYLSIFFSQEAAAIELVHQASVFTIFTTSNCTPDHIGYPLDKIEVIQKIPHYVREKIEEDL